MAYWSKIQPLCQDNQDDVNLFDRQTYASRRAAEPLKATNYFRCFKPTDFDSNLATKISDDVSQITSPRAHEDKINASQPLERLLPDTCFSPVKMAKVDSADAWDDHSSKWASSVQDITRAPCKELLSMATSLSPITSSSKILDNGAGGGMFTQVIREAHPECQITAADIFKGMISTLSQNDWENVQTVVANAMDLKSAGLQDQTFTHSMGTFFLPFVPDPAKVIAEMQRVTKPGGVLALSTWSRVSWVPIWQQAVRETVHPNWTAPHLFHTGTTELEDVRRLLEQAGLDDVQAKTFACPHPKKESPEAAVEEFLNMGNPSTKLLMRDFDEEQIERIRPAFVKAYGERYDGVSRPQDELAVLAVGRVRR